MTSGNEEPRSEVSRRPETFAPTGAQQVLDQFVDVQRFDLDGLEAAAIAKNRDTIGDLKNLPKR